ncbi:MAG: L,D-transpeptidase family protein [Parasphingorhabdus sp.]|nr:L,D-transpeptidase family protein [Parasphingorhabdus sp.]
MRYRFLFALTLIALCAVGGFWIAPKFQHGFTNQPENPDQSDDFATDRLKLTPAAAVQGAADKLLPSNAKSLLLTGPSLKYGEFLWNDNGIGAGKVEVFVNLQTQLVSVYRGGHEIGTAVILSGAEGLDTPIGRFPIRAKSKDYRSKTYDNAPMPYSLWLTADGVALHGSEVRWGRATHGCVGVPLKFAQRLFDVTKAGDFVEIVRSAPEAI